MMHLSWSLVCALLFCLLTVNARHHAEPMGDTDELTNTHDQPASDNRKWSHGQRRHRRKRWQSNMGYNYPAPPQPFYEDRRDYGQTELQTEILRMLDEISAYVKKPTPPQPLYIPYPVLYPTPQQQCNCGSQKPTKGKKPGVPDLEDRIKMDDDNQNWGFIDNEDVDNASYDRPISFIPIKPAASARMPETSRSETKKTPTNQSPRICDAAILSCCRPSDTRQQQLACFTTLGCSTRYTNTVCAKDSVNSVLDVFSKAYSPTTAL